jgi:hypothetical protein
MRQAIIFLVLILFSTRLTAQIDSVFFTALPCNCHGSLSHNAEASLDTSVIYYEWNTLPGGNSQVWFNGSPGPVQTAVNNVSVSCLVQDPFYVICVTAHSACCVSNTQCDTIWNTLQVPVIDTIPLLHGIPGDSLVVFVDSVNCPPLFYVWTIDGDATLEGAGQSFLTQVPYVHINFGPTFIMSNLCVAAVSALGNSSDTMCAVITIPVGAEDEPELFHFFYYHPPSQNLIMEFADAYRNPVHVEIIDITGRILNRYSSQQPDSSGRLELETVRLPYGVYYAIIHNREFFKAMKFAVTE